MTWTLGHRQSNNSIFHLPQVAEKNIPRSMDVARECLLYDEFMTRVFLAASLPEERSALRLVLKDLKMEVVGEAADWVATLAQAPVHQVDLLLIDWDLLSTEPNEALKGLRQACPEALVIVLISHLDARQQAALSAGADAFISKNERPERLTERLRIAAASVLNK